MKKLLFAYLALMVFFGGSLMAKELVIDKNRSSATFVIKHLKLTSVDGKFNEFDGKISLSEDGKKITSFVGNAVVKSIDTDNEKRDAHLNAPDYFDSAKYPFVEFKSTKQEGDKLYGEISIKGTTKPVVWDVRVAKSGDTTVVTLTGELNRLDFGVGEKSAMLADDLKLKILIEGK